MKIGLLGFDINSSNKGCEALTYSFIKIVNSILKKKEFEFHVFGYNGLGELPNYFSEAKFIYHRIHLRKISDRESLKNEFNKCNFIFDVTFGDGFSDIYGKKWNIITNLTKTIAIKSKAKYVLLPQTYGPYNSKLLKLWAKYIIKKADYVFSRDEKSTNFINFNIKNKEVFTTIDMAFVLPYEKSNYIFKQGKKVGINISSLMYDASDNQNNNYGLNINYREVIKRLINYFLENGYIVHLIPHVIDEKNYNSPENDCRVIDKIKECFNNRNVIVADKFKNPIDAKSYIANMDLFIGSRMHSTIASISSGVPTVAISYSRKFEGLYKTLGYNFLVSGKEKNDDQIIEYIVNCVENRFNDMKKNIDDCEKNIKSQITNFVQKLEIIIKENKDGNS